MTIKEYLGLGDELGSGGHGRVYASVKADKAVKVIPLKPLPVRGPGVEVSVEFAGYDGDNMAFELDFRDRGGRRRVKYYFSKDDVRKMQLVVNEIEVLQRVNDYSIRCGGRLVGYHSHQFIIDRRGYLCGVVELDRVEGYSIKEIERKCGLTKKVEMCYEILEAVEDFHRLGYMHLDIKPENVMVDKGGVVLVDYSASKPQASKVIGDLDDFRLGEAGVVSASATFIGTPTHVAPEQAMGRPCAASDYYSAGLVILEILDKYPLDELHSIGRDTLEDFLVSNQMNPKKTQEIVERISDSPISYCMNDEERDCFLGAIGRMMSKNHKERTKDDFQWFCEEFLRRRRDSSWERGAEKFYSDTGM